MTALTVAWMYIDRSHSAGPPAMSRIIKNVCVCVCLCKEEKKEWLCACVCGGIEGSLLPICHPISISLKQMKHSQDQGLFIISILIPKRSLLLPLTKQQQKRKWRWNGRKWRARGRRNLNLANGIYIAFTMQVTLPKSSKSAHKRGELNKKHVAKWNRLDHRTFYVIPESWRCGNSFTCLKPRSWGALLS